MFLAHKQYFPLFFMCKASDIFHKMAFFILVLFEKPMIDIMICACSYWFTNGKWLFFGNI